MLKPEFYNPSRPWLGVGNKAAYIMAHAPSVEAGKAAIRSGGRAEACVVRILLANEREQRRGG